MIYTHSIDTSKCPPRSVDFPTVRQSYAEATPKFREFQVLQNSFVDSVNEMRVGLDLFLPQSLLTEVSDLPKDTVTMSKHALENASQAKHDSKRRKTEKKDKKDKKEKKDKKSRTSALRYEDITPSSTEATAESTPVPEPQLRNHADEEEEGGIYAPNPALNAVAQGEIDQFFKEQAVKISDPQKTGLRPILAFTHLPSTLSAQFSSTFTSFKIPSAIQSSAWPFLLSGRDVVGVAETGSGKTLAFGIPLVVRLASLKKKKGIRAVIITPTRELAIQVFEQLDKLCQTATAQGGKAQLKATCIYGGTNKDEQRRSLKDVNIIVATPGRLKDFMSDNTIDVSKTRYLVLDEADRMLDKGFEDDIKHIVSLMPSSKKRQTAMFTATWPKSIRELAATFMSSPVKITIGRDDADDSGELRANTRIVQKVEVVDGMAKQGRLMQLLKDHTAGSKRNDRILVFCLYKKEAQRIENFIRTRGFNVAGIHGDMAQSARIPVPRGVQIWEDDDSGCDGCRCQRIGHPRGETSHQRNVPAHGGGLRPSHWTNRPRG